MGHIAMTWRVVHPPLSSSGHIQARKKNSSVRGACNSQWTLSEAKCMQESKSHVDAPQQRFATTLLLTASASGSYAGSLQAP
jgi:hypothetical protein